MILTERNKKINLEFYQNLGKLFYAIAAADNHLRQEEIDALNEIVKKDWLMSDLFDTEIKANVSDSIIGTFKWLQDDNEYDAKACYNNFVDFKKKNEQLFDKKTNALILKTARTIAFSFSGINKKELIMLAKLKLELKKPIEMDYYFTTITKGSFETIESNVTALLKEEGFGLITQIDMQQTFKNKLNIDFNKYKILGACNPTFAYKALKFENKIGTMLPCNIIIQEISPNTIEVSAINPMVSMQAVKNEKLKDVAQNVSIKLKNVIDKITNEK